MARSLILLVITSCALGAPPQDDPVETRTYDVAVLTRSTPDFPGDRVGINVDAIGSAVAAGEEYRCPIDSDELIDLLKESVAPDSWKDETLKIRLADGMLEVTQKKSAHDRIAEILRQARTVFGRRISIDAAMVSVDPQVLSRIRAGGDPDRPGMLSADQRRTLLGQAEVLKSMRLLALPGQRVHLQELVKRSYIRDHDVQIATGEGTLDPCMDVLATGPSVDVRAWLEPFEGGVTLELRLDSAEFEALDERKLRIPKEIMAPTAPEAPKPPTTSLTLDRTVQLPKIQHDRVRTMVTVRDRETAIAGLVLRKSRAVLFLITPGVIAAEEKAPADGTLRLFDVSALSRRVQSWYGPSLDLHSLLRGGGGPLVGATFTLEEPSVLIESPLKDLIRLRAGGEATLDSYDQALLVRGTPEARRDAEKALSSVARGYAATVTTEVVVIGFRGGTRLDWEKEVPALAPGGHAAAAEAIDKLLEAAAKGAKVRVVDRAEVTSVPGQRVYTLRSRQEAYLMDYEPQVSTYVSIMDPIMGTFVTGFLLEVCARPQGADTVAVELRVEMSSGEMKDVDVFGGRASAVQAPQAKVLRWIATVPSIRGAYGLVALQSTGSGEDAEELAVFVRARRNVLKVD